MMWTRGRARGVRRSPGEMNRLEAEYASYLDLQMKTGLISWWGFEPIKLRLAKNTFYTPDFLVMKTDLSLEVHEVKGFWEDDARVKIKVASAQFPFQFIAITKEKKEWKFETF